MHVEERASPIDGVVTDDALTLEARHGDGPAMAAIFRSYHQPLYRFCLAIVGNPQDAQDALQNTMVMVLRALPGERRHIALKPWLYRIAHNQSIDLLRRRRQSVPLDESAPAVGEELAVRVEMRQRLRQLIVDLDALPERQRQALLMREAANLDFEEIGAALETTAAAARQTLYEARLSLRQMEAGREMSCGFVTAELSDGDGRARRRRDIRAHLRTCAGCREFVAEIDSRGDALAAIAPLPAVAAAAILHGVVGGGGAAATGAGTSGGGGLAGLLGGGAAKSLGTATLLKGVAAVALVAAIGVGAADRDGLIHLGHGGAASVAPVGAPGGAEPTASGADPAAPRRSAVTLSSSPPGRGRPHRSSASGGAAPVGARGTVDSSAATPGSPSRSDGTLAPAPTPAATAVGGQASSDPATTTSSSAPGTTAAPGAAGDSGATGTSSKEGASTSPGKSGEEHPAGKTKHEKQLPAAAAHGQEMAATHGPENAPGHGAEKTAGHGGEKAAGAGGSGSSQTETAEPGAEHPAHPVHPTHPSKPTAAVEPEPTVEAAPPTETSPAAEPETPTEPAPTEPAAKPPHGKKP